MGNGRPSTAKASLLLTFHTLDLVRAYMTHVHEPKTTEYRSFSYKNFTHKCKQNQIT